MRTVLRVLRRTDGTPKRDAGRPQGLSDVEALETIERLLDDEERG